MKILSSAMAAAVAATTVPLVQLVKIFMPRTDTAMPGNLLTYSGTLTNPVWVANNTSCVQNQPAPDGSTNGATLVTATATLYSYVKNSITIAASTNYNRSCIAKAGTTSNLIFETTIAGVTQSTSFNLTTGAISGSLTAGATMVFQGNGWWACALNWTSGAGVESASVIYIDTYGPASASSTLTVFGVQVEVGSATSGYIPTGATALYGNYMLFNTSNREIDWAGYSFIGASPLGTISQIADAPGEIKGLSFQFSGATSALITTALDGSDIWQGSAVQIYTAILNANYTVIDAVLEWSGLGDTLAIDEAYNASLINATAESSAVDLLKGSVSTISNADQQAINPTDTIFQYVTNQTGKPIVWPARSWFLHQ